MSLRLFCPGVRPLGPGLSTSLGLTLLLKALDAVDPPVPPAVVDPTPFSDDDAAAAAARREPADSMGCSVPAVAAAAARWRNGGNGNPAAAEVGGNQMEE